MTDFELDQDRPLVLLLGGVTHEGIVSALSAAGRQYQQKLPESKVENWHSIVRYFDAFAVRQVIWKMSHGAYERLAHPDYREVRDLLLAKVAAVPHIIFVHKDLLSGRADSDWSLEFAQPPVQIRESVNELFDKQSLNVLPYTRNAELTVLASEFIADTEQGLLLRVYVPSGRMWSLETDKLLQLFRDYLARVSDFSVRLDQTRTDRGIIYEFHGEDGLPPRDLSTEFGEFSRFLDLCVSEPDHARKLLQDRSIAQQEVAEILTRYSKEARRIHVDLRQDRERMLLTVRHKLESELVDAMPSPEAVRAIDALVDATVPRVAGIGSATSIDQSPLRIESNASSVTVNLNPQIIESVEGVVAREVRGDVHLSPQDQELLALIQQDGGAASAELASAVHELADASAPTPGRLVARQRLMKFLIGIRSRLGDVATGVLQSYIEGKLGL